MKYLLDNTDEQKNSHIFFNYILPSSGTGGSTGRVSIVLVVALAMLLLNGMNTLGLVSLVGGFSHFMDNIFTLFINDLFGKFYGLFEAEAEDEEIDVGETLCLLIEKMISIEPKMATLDEVALASVGIPVIVGMLDSAFSTKRNPLSISSSELVETMTIENICVVVERARARVE